MPEVAKFPRQWVYEPWLAPAAAQKAAGCLVGTDYPRPIVDHARASKVLKHIFLMKHQSYEF